MDFKWIDGFEINVEISSDIVTITANKEGLLSLANHLTSLANQNNNDHFHLDENNSLEEGSKELIICKK